MSLYQGLLQREAEGRPVGVAIIGAGKFASMFLAQARVTPGLRVLGVCDLDPGRAREALARTGWPAQRLGARSTAEALARGTVRLTDDAAELIEAPGTEVVVESTGVPGAGIRHALACCEARRHVVMVNVEADVLAGPLLARRAREAGIVYTLAWGDQPALIVDLVEQARVSGLGVVCAGKGTKYLPAFHASTPDTVWEHYGLSPEQAARGGMNARMFNSFLDGTKSAIEMAAVANATGLQPPAGGLGFPPCGTGELAERLRPREAGGVLERAGTVEVVSSVHRDGSAVRDDLRWGVYVVFEAPSAYTARCFGEYGLVTDAAGRCSALWRPYHLIGLELGVSVASAALRGEATGSPQAFRGDVVAVAKRDLRAGETLDGEGGHCVWGQLLPAAESLAVGGLPIGLAHQVRLRAPVGAGETVCWRDVEVDPARADVRVRREMEAALGAPREALAGG